MSLVRLNIIHFTSSLGLQWANPEAVSIVAVVMQSTFVFCSRFESDINLAASFVP